MLKITPAAQLYTLRNFCTNLSDIEKTFKRVKNMGYNHIQMSGMDFSNPKKIAELIEKYELNVCLTHMPLDRLINDFDNIVNEHKAYGCDTIGIGGLPDEYQTSAAKYLEFSKLANQLTKKLKACQMNFSYHNHAFELARLEDTNGLDIIISNTDELLFTLDLYWLQAGGAFPLEYLKKLKGRVKVAHFKDMSAKGNSPILAPVGLGNMNYLLLTQCAEDAGVKYAAVEQDECYEQDPFECLKISLDNINNYIHILNNK